MDTRKMQDERQERARAALAGGEYKITPLDGAWSIVNGDNTPYRVTHDTCECKDFEFTSKHGVMCKHIYAIRILFPQGGQKHMNDTSTNNPINGWTRLFHPSGAQVTLPVMYDTARNMFAQVDAFLEVGFQVNAPGLEEGEQKQEVVSVSRREGKDGVPIVAFYLAHPKTVKKFLHSYLNTKEDVAAFEAATGLKLESIPLWPGERDIDKDAREAGKYIVQLPRPLNLIWEVTQKWQNWSAEGGKATGAIEPHKRALVRYESVAAPSKPATGPLPPAPQTTVAPVRTYLDGSACSDDAAATNAFDQHVSKVGKAPESLAALRTWYASNNK
jgi:hypothetical protein